MTIALALFASIAGHVGLMLWHLGQRRPALATYAAAVLATLAWFAVTYLPGLPKPARVEMFSTLDRAEVLWFAGSEADGISIVLAGPRLYGLPWSPQTMRALHEASQAAEGQGGTVRLRRGQPGAEGGAWSAEHVPPAEPEPKG